MAPAPSPNGEPTRVQRRRILDDPDALRFEQVYEAAGNDLTQVPWANLRGNPRLVAWLDQHPAPAGQRALVVACGLGDDAEELSRRGYEVTAFDSSPTAIEWCRTRFPNSNVDYHVADLFDLPANWHNRFDLVVEINTIQALPPPRHGATIAAIAGTVAAGGRLVVITFSRDEDEPAEGGPPYPLSRSELAAFAGEGLQEVEATEDTIVHERFPHPINRLCLTYERPAASTEASGSSARSGGEEAREG